MLFARNMEHASGSFFRLSKPAKLKRKKKRKQKKHSPLYRAIKPRPLLLSPHPVSNKILRSRKKVWFRLDLKDVRAGRIIPAPELLTPAPTGTRRRIASFICKSETSKVVTRVRLMRISGDSPGQIGELNRSRWPPVALPCFSISV